MTTVSVSHRILGGFVTWQEAMRIARDLKELKSYLESQETRELTKLIRQNQQVSSYLREHSDYPHPRTPSSLSHLLPSLPPSPHFDCPSPNP